MDSSLNIWQALALAAIQGLTEFLPVSSSGHLVLARKLFGWSDEGGLVFDTVLHAGSLAAILIYFWREWVFILRAYIPGMKFEIRNLKFENQESQIENRKSKIENTEGAYYRKLPWLVIVATLPVVIAGPFLKPALESDAIIRNSAITGLSMIATALLFFLAERIKRTGLKTTNPCPSSPRRSAPAKPGQGGDQVEFPSCGGVADLSAIARRATAESRGGSNFHGLSFLNAVFIGCLQVVALLPGASRSGWTTAGGMLCGQDRSGAVRFAFFMAIPAIAGAIIFQSREIFQSPQAGFEPLVILAGFGISFAASMAAIHFCIKYFRNHSLRPFAVYLMVIGIIALLMN